ncbi:hypothetical protein ABPG77_002300 [Micractinium sp. CCAP 211/92]
MPQTWLVVCCHSCSKFQVDQEKKAKKWQCKVCGEKQSLQRIFARSHSAKDCRQVVQQYNSARGQIEDAEADRALLQAYAEAGHGYDADAGFAPESAAEGWVGEQGRQQQQQGQLADAAHPGRWLEYAAEDEDDDGGCTVAVPERAVQRKRGGGAGRSQQGGDGKRRRQQQEQDRWGSREAAGGEAGWPATGQHLNEQQQLPQRHRPLGVKNQADMGTVIDPGRSLQAPQQQPSCAKGAVGGEGQSARHQQGWQTQQPQHQWQPVQQQEQQPQHQWREPGRQTHQAQQERQWQQQRSQPLAAPHRASWTQPSWQGLQQEQALKQEPVMGQQSLQAPLAGATSRWGTFVEVDEW